MMGSFVEYTSTIINFFSPIYWRLKKILIKILDSSEFLLEKVLIKISFVRNWHFILDVVDYVTGICFVTVVGSRIKPFDLVSVHAYLT